MLGSFGKDKYQPLKNSSTIFQRQIRFQPKADNPSKQLQKSINLPKENEVQDRLNELLSLPLNELSKTTNI